MTDPMNPLIATIQDFKVMCTRCRNQHMESERKTSKPDALGIRNLICPRCSGHSYYKL